LISLRGKDQPERAGKPFKLNQKSNPKIKTNSDAKLRQGEAQKKRHST
jgi:hypothetical protein